MSLTMFDVKNDLIDKLILDLHDTSYNLSIYDYKDLFCSLVDCKNKVVREEVIEQIDLTSNLITQLEIFLGDIILKEILETLEAIKSNYTNDSYPLISSPALSGYESDDSEETEDMVPDFTSSRN